MSSVVFSQVMDARQWRAAAAAHEARAGRYADPFAQRRARHEVHPVEDFLFTYYTLKPGQFKRWHPGAGVILLDAPERASWRFYRRATEQELLEAGCSLQVARAQADAASAVTVDVTGFVAAPRYRPRLHPRDSAQHGNEEGSVRLLRHARVGDGVQVCGEQYPPRLPGTAPGCGGYGPCGGGAPHSLLAF